MPPVELIWPPFPFRAGFCITDDTDAATLESVRIVYDLLASIGLVTTKTVWPFEAAEPCGIPPLPASILRGVTLQDPAYRAYCDGLHARGFEICLHGASAGNNVRERTARALDLVGREFGRPGTFVCHAKNAENLYWHEKVAPRSVQPLLAPLSRYRCSGEDPTSPYFWGDLCFEQVRYMRLFRTSKINTLAANPSMPYFDPEKPLVRSWFAATKRSFHDCTAPEALESLRREHGLCVLYQYLHRYADLATGRPRPAFQADAERLTQATGILVATTSAMMDRLRMIQAILLVRAADALWVINCGDQPAAHLQIVAPADALVPAEPGARFESGVVHIPRLEAGAMLRLPIRRWAGLEVRGALMLDATGRGRKRFAFGEVFVNLGDQPWPVSGAGPLSPRSHRTVFDREVEHFRPRSRAGAAELYRLLGGQASIIARELLFKGRSPSMRKFLSGTRIALEDHANW